MTDPRFTTKYSDQPDGPFFFRQHRFLLPPTVYEQYCEPGYQPRRQDKGFDVTVNDYPFQNINYGGLWSNYVHTPFKTYN